MNNNQRQILAAVLLTVLACGFLALVFGVVVWQAAPQWFLPPECRKSAAGEQQSPLFGEDEDEYPLIPLPSKEDEDKGWSLPFSFGGDGSSADDSSDDVPWWKEFFFPWAVERDEREAPGNMEIPHWDLPEGVDFDTETPSASVVTGEGTTSTVLLLDTSGSMDDDDRSGKRKIRGAVDTALDFVTLLRNENKWAQQPLHQVAVVDFDSSSRVYTDLTTDMDEAEDALRDLYADGGTAMAEGLQNAIDILANAHTEKRIIILLTDGVPTVSLFGEEMHRGAYDEAKYQRFKNEVLRLAREAKEKGICINTIGFGIPGKEEGKLPSLDEPFLKQVAEVTGCGKYYRAEDAFLLRDVFVQSRHEVQGQVLLHQTGEVGQNDMQDLGIAQVPRGQDYLRFTLLWEEGDLLPVLVDPHGQQVEMDRDDLLAYFDDGLVDMFITNPLPGDWRVGVYGDDVPSGETVPFSVTVSSHPGAIAGVFGPKWLLALGCLGGVLLLGLLFLVVFQMKRSRGGTHKMYARPLPPDFARINAPAALVTVSGKVLPLTRRQYLLGRGPGSHIQFPDQSVSRHHARLRYVQGAWMLQDLGSTGGTWVNGQRIQAHVLRSGDQIRLGDYVLYFYQRH